MFRVYDAFLCIFIRRETKCVTRTLHTYVSIDGVKFFQPYAWGHSPVPMSTPGYAPACRVSILRWHDVKFGCLLTILTLQWMMTVYPGPRTIPINRFGRRADAPKTT